MYINKHILCFIFHTVFTHIYPTKYYHIGYLLSLVIIFTLKYLLYSVSVLYTYTMVLQIKYMLATNRPNQDNYC